MLGHLGAYLRAGCCAAHSNLRLRLTPLRIPRARVQTMPLLEALNLEGNALGPANTVKLCAALRHATALRKLILRSTKIGTVRRMSSPRMAGKATAYVGVAVAV